MARYTVHNREYQARGPKELAKELGCTLAEAREILKDLDS